MNIIRESKQSSQQKMKAPDHHKWRLTNTLGLWICDWCKGYCVSGGKPNKNATAKDKNSAIREQKIRFLGHK